MFGWSPPNILATLVLGVLLFLQFHRSPTQAKPYRRQDVLSTYTAGNLGGVHERDWPELISYKKGEYVERKKRSPTEEEDERTLTVTARKRQGIETPIQALTSNSGLDLPLVNNDEKVRSNVDQPNSGSVGITAEENTKAVDDGSVMNNSKESDTHHSLTQSESSEEHQDENENENHSGNKQEAMDNNKVMAAQDKADSVTANLSADSGNENKNNESDVERKADSSRSADENAQVRSIKEADNIENNLGGVPNDKSGAKSVSLAKGVAPSTKTNQQETQTTNTNSLNNQQVDSDANKVAEAKAETSGVISGDQRSSSPTTNSAAAKFQPSDQETKPPNTASQTDSEPAEPVRDALGNSGSEIVTTHSHREPQRDSYSERDAETKPASGPEVGHFQVDDKSADLEINANSAGVKVKAKPASLQVVSRPGSHPASGAQERSFFGHYHYPPFHHHHWFPGYRRSYGHFHRRHFFNPYHSYPERHGFESFYEEAPFYRRRLPYWYPHRFPHHYRDSYLYERSRLEEPEDFSKFHRRRRHKRRFRHMNGPYRRQFYNNNNIPIMNDMDSAPPMGVAPEEGTMPQLPLGPGQQFAQRQNIITPMPPPINVDGNPPPGLLGGMNAALFGMNGLSNLNGINGISGPFSGISSMRTMGFNSPGQMAAMEGFSGGLNGGLGSMEAVGHTRGMKGPFGPRNFPVESPRRAFKKTAILSGKKLKDQTKKDYSHDETKQDNNKDSKENLENTQFLSSPKKGKINLKSWEKTLKRYHRLNLLTAKAQEKHQFRRNLKSFSVTAEKKDIEEKSPREQRTSRLHAQHTKEVKGKRKNEIVMHRPPIIYHPPPEIYHRPDIVVHRAPIMLHRPPIIYHQPPVVVHRPAIIYHQPPIVFHQPPPMVHQPILHSHDTWVTKPVVYHTASTVSHEKTYYGIPSHVYAGSYGEGCHGGHCSYRKGNVPHKNTTKAKNSTLHKKTKRDSFTDYMAYFTSLWKANHLNKRNVHDDYDFITSSDGARAKLSYKNMIEGSMTKRDSVADYREYLHSIWNQKVKRATDDSKNGTEKKRKKDVVVNRPPIIYHPPPEIYHRPDIVVHRPPLVIHRPPIIYHQPPVIVHRPAVVYHQPPIVFHQPPPAVSQPLLYSHDSFTVHPTFYATHHGSVVRDFGHYVGVPNVITNYGNPLFGRAPPIGKRSKIEKLPTNEDATSPENTSLIIAASKNASLDNNDKAKNESSEKAGKKNTVLVHRPPIIYHPPPEIYHRPIIVVHRPPIMIHRAPIFYHQPPVVVHRPAIVYHQPPLIFHQPPPMVHQPVLRSHDTWISHPVVTPYSSRILHHHTYVGVPDAYTVHHFAGEHGFYKSHILKHTHQDDEHAFERNEITGGKNATKQEKDSLSHHPPTSNDGKKNSTLNLKSRKTATQKGGKKNAVIVRRPPVIYHPPPEIYHRPEIVVHRAPIVIHRAPIIYHQPPVIVHRPAIVYHQPPLIFHQPPPVVHQPVFRSHDTYIHRPVARLYATRMRHVGHLYHIPHAYYHGHGGAVHYMAYGKSKVPRNERMKEEEGDTRTTVKKSKKSKTKKKSRHTERKHATLTKSKDKTETGTKLHENYKVLYHKAKETTERAHKKNSVVIHRPPIIYHPPPEIYHRPDIVVHRAPIVLYRAPIVYHQPPVVVHRPAIVYHQPPIVFHQPPPMVHQPVLHSHDTWVAKPVVVPYASHVRHIATYRGVPHEEIFMHGIGTGAFGKSRVPVTGSRRNEINNIDDKNQTNDKESKTATKLRKGNRKGKNRTAKAGYNDKEHKERIGALHRMTRALRDSLADSQWESRDNKNSVEPGARIQRSLHNFIPAFIDQLPSAVLNLGLNDLPDDPASVLMRVQRSINDLRSPMGAGDRIQRAVSESWNQFQALNYGLQGFHQNSPHVSINVETVKRQGIPSAVKDRRSPVARKLKQHEETTTGNKRDELLQQGGNGQEITPYQGNSNFMATSDNQYVSTSESNQPPQEITPSETERIQTLSQQPQLMPQSDVQQQEQELDQQGQQQLDQQQEQQQDLAQQQQQQQQQQQLTFPNQPAVVPLQAQQPVFRGPPTPLQLPMQLPLQPAFNEPVVAPFTAPVQSVIPNAFPGVSSNPTAEQSTMQQQSDTVDGQPKHTTINVNVAAKSIVPEKTPKKRNKSGKRQFVPSQLQYVHKKPEIESASRKREKISLLTRFPAMQVLPQTFKQDGVMMPAFNTLPVNHRVKPNGMLLEELQMQKKHHIPRKHKIDLHGTQRSKLNNLQQKPKENARKRQFYIVPQSMLPAQPDMLKTQSSIRSRPKISVSVEVNKRFSAFPQRKYHSQQEDVKRGLYRQQNKSKRQVYGIIQFPQASQASVANTPLMPQIPLEYQRPRVSVHVESAKKTLTEEAIKREQNNKEKRQIYGLSELPNGGMMQPFPVASQTQPLRYFPRAMHSPHVSINVVASKRSGEDTQDDIQKRQVLGLQPSSEDSLQQVQETVPIGQATYQDNEIAQEEASQSPIQEQEQQQDVQELPTQGIHSEAALNVNTLNERPRVSVHVEASKRGENGKKQRDTTDVKRSAKEKTGDKRQLQQADQVQNFEQNVQEQGTFANAQQDVGEQEQQVSPPLAFLSPTNQKHQIQPIQPVMLPLLQPQQEKAGPKVSISVETSKSSILKHNDRANEYRPEQKKKRQLFGTVPLLSSLGQNTAPGSLRMRMKARSSVPVSGGSPDDEKDYRLQKRQFYNFLGGQQEQTIPNQAIQDTTETEQQQQDIPIQPFQQMQLSQMNLQEVSELESNNKYPGQIEIPVNSEQSSTSPIQSESALSPFSKALRPHVSINVQTAKSQVPTAVTTTTTILQNSQSNPLDHEKKKFKRQFEILGGNGGIIERRRGPKFLTAPPLKKARAGSLLGLSSSLGKSVEVFPDQIANLVAGGAAGRKRPRLGGIQIDSPPSVGALPVKGSIGPLGGTLASEVNAPAIIQDNAAEAFAPFAQEPEVTGGRPFLPPSGIAGPPIDALGKGENGELPLADAPFGRPQILPLPAINQAVVQNLPFTDAAAPPPERPLLLPPRVLPVAPIVPLAPPMGVIPPAAPPPVPTMDEASPMFQHVPQMNPVLPPVMPMPLPNLPNLTPHQPLPPLPSPERLFPQSDDDKPSVHVNVETSRSNVPDTKPHSKKQAKGQASRG